MSGIEAECIQVSWESQNEKKALGNPRCRPEDNMKLDLRKIQWGCMDFIRNTE
jgi:hypothetical protein